MRRGYAFLAVSLCGLGGSVALPQSQDTPTAEKVFKNIVSFKGEKADDVIPAMQFMGASLKVGCDFCHSADRASDDKRAKQTTRAMIAMQREINAKNFGGRNQVTCATCHAGHTHPVAMPPVEGIELRPRRSQDVAAADVLAAYGKAVGNAAIPVLELQGSLVTKEGKTPLEATFAAGKMAFVTKTAKGEERRGFDGARGWVSQPSGVIVVPARYTAQWVNEVSIYLGADTLPKLSNMTGGTAKLGDKENLVVSGTTADGTRVSLFFDKKTGLLSRSAFYYPTILGNMAEINDYSDYRKVNGLLIPMTIASHSPEGDTVEQFRSAHVQSSVDAKLFEAPKR